MLLLVKHTAGVAQAGVDRSGSSQSAHLSRSACEARPPPSPLLAPFEVHSAHLSRSAWEARPTPFPVLAASLGPLAAPAGPALAALDCPGLCSVCASCELAVLLAAAADSPTLPCPLLAWPVCRPRPPVAVVATLVLLTAESGLVSC